MKNALKISFDKEQALDHLVGELKKQIQTLQNELESLVKIQQTTNAELVESRDQHEQVKLRFISLEQENDALRKNNREINDLLDDERENTRKLTEEAEDLKYQIENLNKNIEDANENYKENEVQTKSLEKELENLTMLIAQTQNELAQEKYEKTTQYEDLCLVTTDLEKTKREFSNIKELYEMACRAARSMSSQLSPVNTGTFKDFTMTFAETLPSDFSLHKWVEKAVNELKDICDKYTETVQIIDSTKHKNNILKQDLDHLSQENSSFKSKELMLKSQIESLTKENAYVRETMKMQTGSLQQEILVLRNNVQSLNEENEELASKNRNANNEVIQVKSKVSAQEQSFQSMEKRLRLVVSEKEHLESLLSSYKSMDRSFGSYRNSS
jgi:chromosome segregation ATPase